jgi:hypothetical protein
MAKQMENLTQAQSDILNHISMWGSDGYPVRKVRAGKWIIESFFGWQAPPTVFKTKGAANAQFEACMDLLRDYHAGRVPNPASGQRDQVPARRRGGWPVKPHKVSFKVTKADAALILIAAQRAHQLTKHHHAVDYPVLDAEMDITACHANGCKLDLAKLLGADDGNFGHDVFGIRRHLDRADGSPTAGQLLDCFVPRFKWRKS